MSEKNEHTHHENSDETVGPMLFIALVAMGAFMAVGAGAAHAEHSDHSEHTAHEGEGAHAHPHEHDHGHAPGDAHDHAPSHHAPSHHANEAPGEPTMDDLAAEAAAETLRELEAAGEVVDHHEDSGEGDKAAEVAKQPATPPKPVASSWTQPAAPKESAAPAPEPSPQPAPSTKPVPSTTAPPTRPAPEEASPE